jgi:hypothetical protein
MPAHKNHTKIFERLTYAEQAKSINAAMAWCSKAIKAHLRKARAEGRNDIAVKNKCVNQVSRLLSRIANL